MRALRRSCEHVPQWLSLVLLSVYLCGLLVASSSNDLVAVRTQSPKIEATSENAASLVFCLDVGVEIAFPRRDVEDAETQASIGSGCLRSSPMNVIMGHLRASLRTVSLHAVDCVLKTLDIELSTIALLGIVSLCSRSNVEVETDMEHWGREAKRQIQGLFALDKRIALDQITGMVRQVVLSPPFALPQSGNGLPQFHLEEALIWSDKEEGEISDVTKDQTFVTHVQMLVKNKGTIPLHVFQVVMVEEKQEHDKLDQRIGVVLPLATPTVVLPGKSDVVSFKAMTGVAVDSWRNYVVYISHSGFRSHVFEGFLDGKTIVLRAKSVQRQGEAERFEQWTLTSARGQALLSSLPYATWQVGCMAVAVAVGLAVGLYIRRKPPSVRLVGHVVSSCFSSSKKKRAIQECNGRTSAKPRSTHVASSRSKMAKRGENQIELDAHSTRPSVAETANTNASASSKLLALPHSKMPAITMKWKAPPLPPQAIELNQPSPESPNAETLLLDLDCQARLHPNRFESMWDEYAERSASEFPNVIQPDSDMLLKRLETFGISCMASGTVHGVKKFVFYAKQRNRSGFFLVTLDVTVATKTTVLSLRASTDVAEELVVQLVELLTTTINEFAVL